MVISTIYHDTIGALLTGTCDKRQAYRVGCIVCLILGACTASQVYMRLGLAACLWIAVGTKGALCLAVLLWPGVHQEGDNEA